jgi:hypothetical protein
MIDLLLPAVGTTLLKAAALAITDHVPGVDPSSKPKLSVDQDFKWRKNSRRYIQRPRAKWKREPPRMRLIRHSVGKMPVVVVGS